MAAGRSKIAGVEHFGRWMKRFRERLSCTQAEFAEMLGLLSGQAVYQIEQRQDRRVRGTTLERLLYLVGVEREKELDALWQKDQMPDMRAVKARVVRDRGQDGPGVGGVRYNQGLLVGMLRWLAAHPEDQIREMVKGVPRTDAAAVARALFDRATEE